MTWLAAVRDRYRVAANPLRTERRVELVALLLALLLCLQIAYSASHLALMSIPEAVVPAADALQVKTALSLDAIGAEQSNEVRNRPLFWESRQPVSAPVAPDAPEVPAPEIKGIKLVGVFGGGDAAGIIVLMNGKKRRVRLGEEVKGWTLQSVDTNAAVLTAGARQESLVLQTGRVANNGNGQVR